MSGRLPVVWHLNSLVFTLNLIFMAEHNELGRRGEAVALRYLKDKAYTILESNWRSGHMEIDIIARKHDELIIAEVKTRRKNSLATLDEVVNKRKQNLLIKAANSYIGKSNLNLDVRFDILIVIFSNMSGARVYHIENAFYPTLRS